MGVDYTDGEYEFGWDCGNWCIVHKHLEDNDHYPYGKTTVRYFHVEARQCIECQKPHPEFLLLLRDLMQ